MTRLPYARQCLLCLVLVLSLAALAGCGGAEPEQRKAFIAFLKDAVSRRTGNALPVLSREEEKSFGDYTEHYAVLVRFQKDLAAGTAENTRHLLAFAGITTLEGMIRAESSLKNAAREAQTLERLARDCQKTADKAKKALSRPEDLAPVYDAVYEKTVTLPAEASAAAFAAARAAIAANLALVGYITDNSHDLGVADGRIQVYNRAAEPELKERMAAVQAASDALFKAYASMREAMSRQQ
ncbi:MAG: DUF3053 domain-containing protein [Deltaproteobacteria bacterium]|jgi:hypothetical protein|nr:DUF3053 domain-containing protein [Deltaproteobacteria bacterium]